MTKQEAIKRLELFFPYTNDKSIFSETIQIAIECIKESITAEELKNDLLNEFEGVPI